MTDEEMAEEYKESRRLHGIPKERHLLVSQDERLNELKQAFLAGLKAKTQWHKVTDGDLPKNASLVIIAYYAVDKKTVGTKEVKRLKEIVTEPCFYLDNQGWTDTSDGEPYPYLNKKGVVIAWCEIPQFKE